MAPPSPRHRLSLRADGLGTLLPHRRPWWGYLWAAPNTLIGLLGAATTRTRPIPHRGVLLFEPTPGARPRGLARFLAWRGFEAITLGHAIITNTPLDDHVLAHEFVHIRQHERWGPLFYPAYLLTSLAGYRRNPFERAADRASAAPLRRDR
ncbi:MAG TPA: hypothetical protein VF995_09260 [Actinomycetota bacterium]